MPRSRPRLPTQTTVAAVVLAAGSSRRMGDINKLMISIEGTPMVVRVVQALERSRVDRILVVTGHQPERIGEALSDREVELVHNLDYEEGIGTSIRTGISALGKGVDGALIVLADMPWIGAEVVDRLVDAFAEADERSIFIPSVGGKRGNPILWSSNHFPELLGLAGDVGGKGLLHRCSETIRHVEVESTAIRLDIDTPDVLRGLGIDSGVDARWLQSADPPTSPGEMLLEEFLVPMEMTQRALAKEPGLSVQSVNLIIKGKRGITPETAVRLSRVLKNSPQFRLGLQMDCDLWHAERDLAEVGWRESSDNVFAARDLSEMISNAYRWRRWESKTAGDSPAFDDSRTISRTGIPQDTVKQHEQNTSADILMTMSQIPDVNRELAEIGAVHAIFAAVRRERGQG